MAAYKNKDNDSVLYRHVDTTHKHEENTPEFVMSEIDKHKSALDRQISEAVRIHNTPSDLLMNRKSEWGHTRIVRSVLTAE